MKRKTFIKVSSLAAGGLMAPWSCAPGKEKKVQTGPPRKNWAGNYQYKALQLHEPSTVEELQKLIKGPDQLKALGSTHCFNDIADSPQHQISTRKLNKVVGLDKANGTFTVEAGARYGDFAKQLHSEGYALHNLASLPHITVAGACSTATHGSGVGNGNLATAVEAVELMTPQGDLLNIGRDHTDFPAVVVGLGAFGIITKVTLAVEPAYEVMQHVFLEMPLESVENSFDEIMSSGYSVSLFTDWMDRKVSEVWVKRRMDANPTDLGQDFYGAVAATENIHPVIELSAESCSEQMGVPGPWYDRLPHFKMGFTPSAGDELQSEFFVPYGNAVDALLAIEKMKEAIYPHLIISEIRTVAADDFWMSPCYEQDSVAIHFTWKPKPKEVLNTIPKIEAELAPFGVKPHWGKLFKLAPDQLRDRYERYGDFLSAAKRYDPEGKFRNDFLDLNIY